MSRAAQSATAAGVLAVGGVLAFGARLIPSEAGYAGVGPDFLPWVVAAMLVVCGALLVREALTGGFRDSDAPEGAAHGDWWGFAWVTLGILLNAALITTLGFILSCALCFVLAARGLRIAAGQQGLGLGALVKDVASGLLIAAPVYWMFTKALSISLPGLTRTGWL
jgi:putative tricarboxylic transport membrane protein